MKRIILISIVLMLTMMVGAQTNYRQRQLTMDGGLATNNVNAVVQDQRGFIWIGTSNGLCRYDGITVKGFRRPDSDGMTDVKALLVDDENGLLVATVKGLFHLSFDTEEFKQLPPRDEDAEEKIESFGANSMVKDKDGQLWIATQGKGIVRYNLDDEETKQYDLPNTKGDVSKVFIDKNNQLWALCSGSEQVLWQLNRSTDSFVAVQTQGLPTNQVMDILESKDGKLWIGTQSSGLMLYHDDGTMEQMSATSMGHAQHVNTLFTLSANQLLLGCDDGLWLFDTTLRTCRLYLTQRFVTAIAIDHEGGLWVGTHYSGISYMSPIAHRFDSYSVGSTNVICEDRMGRIWMTRANGGLSCHPKGHPEQVIENYAGHAQLDNLKIHDLRMDGDDLWMGTVSDGVYVYSTTSGHIRHYASTESKNSLYDLNSCTLLRDSKGDMWVATMNGLCRYRRQSNDFERIIESEVTPVDLDEDKQGFIWLSTQGDGLRRYNPKSGEVDIFHHDRAVSTTINHDIVNCVFVDGKGLVWVGTQGGLCRFNESKQRFERIPLNLPRPGIASITEQQGVLWMAGDCGVIRYDEKQNVQRFTQQDGLISEQFHPNAVLSGRDGRIYFGNINGFNAFYPQHIVVNTLSAPVFLTQLDINNQPIEVGTWHLPKALSDIEKLDLWYNDKVITLSFASLSYCSPEKNMYAYMLEGFDKHWNYVGHDNRATYTNLEPGDYTFYVKATNNDGIWSDRVARLKIEVHPPFWWNIYAKILYVVLFLLFITVFIRFRLYMTERRHRKEIERLNKAKDEEMRVARTEFFTTIAHEIRTPVSLIIGPLDMLKTNLQKTNATKTDFETLNVVDRNAHRLLDLVNQLLDFRKVEQSRVDMNFAPQNMCELLRSVVDNFETVFKLSGRKLVTTYPDEHFTAVVDREGMVKLLSNLLSNANKYTKDTITLTCQPDPKKKVFRIEVGDNGSGISKEDQKRVFDPFFQTKERKPGTGIGLSIVKKLVEQHHGTISLQSELGRGTTFIVELPVSQSFSGEQQPVAKQIVVEQPKTEQTVGNTPIETSEKKPHMLIVEDNEDMLTFLVTTFMDHYEVTSAQDGSEALKIIEESLVVKDGQTPQSTYDIILSDWMMETMDGPELCSRLRQNAATKRIPFILLTAKTDSQSKVDAMQAGVDAFIEKPFAVKYLEACIRNLLTRDER